ncbi:MAG: murein biosynthesis integral membrane protein MurJ [Pseudomonadales bacterium]
MSTGSEVRQQNVAAQGTVVASMTLLSRISGFLRDMMLANFLGAGAVADAFFVAFRIPNFFRRLFAEGAFNQAFVPVLARYREASRAELVTFIQVMSGNLALVLTVVVVVGILAAPALVTVFAPGFLSRPDQFALARDMVEITFPYLGFISLTAFAGAILNSHHRYAVPAFTPVLLNLSLIGAMLIAMRGFDEPVFALAWGVLFAGIAQLLFQLPSLRSLGLILVPKPSLEHEGARRVGVLLVPAIFAASVNQVNALIDTMLASTLMTGSISWLYYSDRLLELPIGLVAVTLSTVLLPNLSRLEAEANLERFRETLDWGFRVGVFFGLPAALALYVLALPLISSIFLHGATTAFDARMAALALEAFAVGLVPLVMVKVLAPAYFAQENTATPFRIGVVAVGVNVVLNLALFRVMGHVGLAFATSVAGCVNAYLLWRGLHLAGRFRVSRLSGWSLGRCVVASGAMVATLLWMTPADEFWLGSGLGSRALWLLGCVATGGGVYLAIMLLLGGRPAHLTHRA